MIKRKRLIASVVTITLLLGLIPYALHTKPMSKAAEHGLSNPRVAQDDTVTWDCVYFGNYWQNDTNGDGVADQNDEKEPIKWRVLSVDGDDAFLLSDKNLDYQMYNNERTNVTWEICTVRNWLNSDFLNNAFSKEEQIAIKDTIVTNEKNPIHGTSGGNDTIDKIYLLSISEASNKTYGFESNFEATSKARKIKNTKYAQMQGSYEAYGGDAAWLLRSLGEEKYYATFVGSDGEGWYNGIDVNSSLGRSGIRPALHLNISNSSLWNYFGTISSDGSYYDVNQTSTPTHKPTSSPSNTPMLTATPTVTPTITPDNGQNNILTSATDPSIQPKESPKVTNEPKTVTAPAKVKGLSAKNQKKKSVTLSWKKVKGAAGYQIQYSANGTVKKKAKNTKKTKFIIKKLKKKKTYSFRVRAYKINSGVKFCGNWCKARKVKIKK